jgi:hypothetical protein
MNEIFTSEIPYERQGDPTSNRLCGAAALCMVYRSFGISAAQAELAPILRGPGTSATASARSYLLAQDALSRGLNAVVFRVRDPLTSLRQSQRPPVRMILNHRLHAESSSGHFSVLVRVGEREVIVHDPQRGPDIRLSLTELAELWRPMGGSSEVAGNVLVAIARGSRTTSTPCPRCSSTLPDVLVCPGCRKPFPVQPTAVLGCRDPSCPERRWEVLFCPHCDTSVAEVGAANSLAGEPPAAQSDPLRLEELNQALDTFVAMLIRASDGNPPVALQNHIATIQRSQAQMLIFQKSEAAERKSTVAAPVTQLPEPDLSPNPAASTAPVDWNELSRTLIQEIGWTPK